MYGHYGNGCIHARWNFDLSSRPGLAKYRAFVEEGADLVVSYGGSISGEHGDGQSRAELLPKMFGPELIEAFREFKSIFDPDWKMNPGKVVDPYPLDSNIRLGPDTFNPPLVDSHFAFLQGQGLVRPRDHALRRRRQVPPHRGRRDVPELHGHPRGDALDARAGPPALGDAERRGADDVARRGGRRGARPLPLVQGLHERLPGERRPADAEGRVPLAPLQAPPAASGRLRLRPDRPGRAPRFPGARGSPTRRRRRRSSSSPPGSTPSARCPSSRRSR